MTMMKAAPLPTFSNTICTALVNSIKDTSTQFGIAVRDEPQLIRKSMSINGDYLAGIRVEGHSFQGAVTLAMDKRIAKAYAEKVFAGTNAKGDEAMLCDLVGELCNQITGHFQRTLGTLGAKMKVAAQETAKSQASFEVGATPEEWLMIPFAYADGRGVLSFGFVGDLGLGSEDAVENLSDAKDITFF